MSNFSESLKSIAGPGKAPLRNRAGEVEGVVGIARDVTRQKDTAAKLRRTHRLEMIGQLAAGIAHEINTPTQYVTDNTRFVRDSFAGLLDLIRLQQRLLQEACTRELGPADKEEIQKARDQVDLDYLLEEIPGSLNESLEGLGRIASIVQSMKEFSHPDMEEMRFADINRAIQSTLVIATSEWKYVATTETDLDPELPQVKCNLGALNQVILNLIVNAAQAIAGSVLDSGEKKLIRIATRSLDGEIEIRVSDNGPGMSPEVKERVFEPFFTTKQVGKGTGQGLSLAHTVIVKKHNGSINVESEPGQGSVFIIRLPIEPAGAANNRQ